MIHGNLDESSTGGNNSGSQIIRSCPDLNGLLTEVLELEGCASFRMRIYLLVNTMALLRSVVSVHNDSMQVHHGPGPSQ